MESFKNIGRGYHDDLRADYYKAIPEEEKFPVRGDYYGKNRYGVPIVTELPSKY